MNDDTDVCLALADFYDEVPDDYNIDEPDAPFCGCGD